jgi:hypothetical protein
LVAQKELKSPAGDITTYVPENTKINEISCLLEHMWLQRVIRFAQVQSLIWVFARSGGLPGGVGSGLPGGVGSGLPGGVGKTAEQGSLKSPLLQGEATSIPCTKPNSNMSKIRTGRIDKVKDLSIQGHRFKAA